MKKNFPEEIYHKIKISDLILISFSNLEGFGKKVSFERLLEECFNLFPKKFSFQKHPNWPDSRKIDRPLRALRKKKMISGNSKENFSITKEGKKKAQQLLKLLSQKKLKLK